MQLLLDKGAKVDVSPAGFATALHMAVNRGGVDAVKVLLK